MLILKVLHIHLEINILVFFNFNKLCILLNSINYIL